MRIRSLFNKKISEVPVADLLYAINNPDPNGVPSSDEFGISIDIFGNYCIIGSPQDNTDGYSSGIAYIFDVTTGNLLHTLNNPNAYGTSSSDYFGNKVAISGTKCVVGTNSEDDAGGENSGKAYIFDVITGNLLHILNNPNAYGTSWRDYFGVSVDISEEYCIVGAHNEDDSGGENSGKAYIFDIVTGNLVRTLSNPNAYGASSIDDYFGYDVAISGKYCAVGAFYEEYPDGQSNSGVVYIFDIETGGLLHTLSGPTKSGTRFGLILDMSDNYLITSFASTSDGSGIAYIYNFKTGTLVHTLQNPNHYGTSQNDYFGWDLGISDKYCVVGAYGEDDEQGLSTGIAYIFDTISGKLLHTITNPSISTPGDRFGIGAAISDNYCIVGAPSDETGTIKTGRAYLYSLNTNKSSSLERVRNFKRFNGIDWERANLNIWEPPPPPPVFDLYSWGINDQGQLGLGDNTLRTSPTQVGSSKWKKICVGNYHTLGIMEDGTLWAWGSNSYYALGTTWGNKISPVQIGTDKWKDISAGSLFSLGIREDGTLWAWGYNNYGQLGLGHTSDRTIPTQVGTDNDWKKVEGYNVSSAALKENGTLWTCGYNANGELGLGDTTNRTSFTQVGTDTWIMISPGNTSQHMGGIKSDGTLWMWGHGWGWKIGNNSTSNRLSPIKITTDKWICIAVDGTCTLGIKENGTLWGWGTNYLNTIGQGAIGAYIRIPVQIGYATNWKLVKTGLHTLAIKTDGTLWSWGANDYGQVGQGNQNTQNNMAQVGFDTTWKDIACGYYHSIGSKD